MKEKFNIHNIPAMLYGEASERVFLFVHGKCGDKEEAKLFAEIACPKGWQVLSIDLPEHGERKEEKDCFAPWYVVPELQSVMKYINERWSHVALRANSIGAWFSMLSFADVKFEKCLFVSPVLDMECLIYHMMHWAGISEKQLEYQKEVKTEFGEILSWKYLEHTKAHPIKCWHTPTAILYAGKDNLTEKNTVDAFVQKFNCALKVMEDGEHWFHTPEQLEVLKQWEETNVQK